MSRDTTRGYRRWIRAVNNNIKRPNSVWAKDLRHRVATAEAFNELRGLSPETVWAYEYPSTKRVELDEPETNAYGWVQRYRHEPTTAREYMCSDYCAALHVQIGSSTMTVERVAELLPGQSTSKWRTTRYLRIPAGQTMPRAVHCRTCNAKIKDGRVVEPGYDITETTEPIPVPPTVRELKRGLAQPTPPPAKRDHSDPVWQLQKTITELRDALEVLKVAEARRTQERDQFRAERDSAYDDLRRASEREGTLINDNIRLTRELELATDRRVAQSNQAELAITALKADLAAAAADAAATGSVTITIQKVVIKNS